MSLLLNVPVAEEATAKARGVLWDTHVQSWYLPDINYDRLMEVDSWIADKDNAIILPDEIMIAHTTTLCRHCNHASPVIAIGSDYFFVKEMNERDEPVWLEQDFFTLFEQTATLSDNLRLLLQENYPHYKPGHSGTTYWNNHCTHCNNPLDDRLLFEEAGSAFHPESQEAAAAISLKLFQFKYAPRIDAGYTTGPYLRLITEFAARNMK
ncbi:hypothetical protein ECE50_024750 [Chitinophaga sp. Mgbs1]|uniref:Uncharacterized protein n=1 Tax=Chitinophaga solisilvae TaxID=1233460 RepID=A0A3S1D1N8_9BACT|nr:hypothetical protein [Chitinophaga solisilvae]